MAKKQEAEELDATASEQTVPEQATEKPVETPEIRNGGQEEADFKKTASDIKSLLSEQPKVRVFVPLETGEKLGEFLPVSINGYRLNVPKGVYVEVPQAVADIISEAYNIYENNSATAMRADRNDETVSALNL